MSNETSDKNSNFALVFVYNADSGIFNTITDIAHKIISPDTYECHLCALTHSPFGMRQEWKDFLESLAIPLEFLHANEFRERYDFSSLALPAILRKQQMQLDLLVNASSINSCGTLEELKQLIRNRCESGL